MWSVGTLLLLFVPPAEGGGMEINMQKMFNNKDFRTTMLTILPVLIGATLQIVDIDVPCYIKLFFFIILIVLAGLLIIPDMRVKKELLGILSKQLENILQNSGGYHLEKITAELYPGLKGMRCETSFQGVSTDKRTPLWQCLKEDWERSERLHYMLVGAGGCGKTIAMQQTARTLIEHKILAIYIPMHDLKPEDGSIEKYIREYILNRNSMLWESLYQACYNGEKNGQPSLVVFLDGLNEVREEKIEQDWFTDLLRVEIKQKWMSLPGAQIVMAGREYADKNVEWNSLLSYLDVMPLPKSQIETYLRTCGIALPDAEDSIWQTISNPLMLVLYVNTAGQKKQFVRMPGIEFISGAEHSSQAAVIWNFLQCQVGKFVCQKGSDPYSYFIAINYAASWVGWNMEQGQLYTLTQKELADLLDKAGENYSIWWLDSPYLKNLQEQLSAVDWQWNTEQIRHILCDETLLLYNGRQEERDNVTDVGLVHFIHQKFRDCYAALYMRSQLSKYGAQKTPEDCHSWCSYAANSEVLDLLDTFVTPAQFNKFWWNQRGVQAHNNSFTMFHLLELYRRKEKKLSKLDFSEQDLRFVSLQNRNLYSNEICFRGAKISRRTLLPQNHDSTLSFLTWLPVSGHKSSDFFLSAGRDLRLWNVRTGESQRQWKSHDSGITCIATSWDGSKFATTSHDKKLLIYLTPQLDEAPEAYEANEELSAVTFSPNDSFLAVGDKTGKVFLCSDTGEFLREIPANEEVPNEKVKMLRFDDSGRYLSALVGKDILLLWRIGGAGNSQLLGMQKAGGKVLDINFERHGTALLYAVEDGTVFRINTNNHNCEPSLQWGQEGILWKAAAFSPDNTVLAAYGKDGLKLLNAFDGSSYKEPLFPEDLRDKQCILISFSIDGQKILCGLDDSSLLVWSAKEPETEAEYKDEPFCIIKAADGELKKFVMLSDTTFLCAFGNGYLTWWNIEQRRCFRCEKLLNVSISQLAISPDKKLLVTAGIDNILNFWDVESLNNKNEPIKLSDTIKDLVFSPKGTVFCCACDDSHVYGWDTTNFSSLFSISLEEKIRILSLVFLSDDFLLGGATNGIIYRWKIPEGTRLEGTEFRMEDIMELAISGDRQFMVSISSDGYLFYWKLKDFCHRSRCKIKMEEAFWNYVAISNDGHHILAGKVDTDGENTLCLLTIRSDEEGIIEKIDKKYIPLPSKAILYALFFSSDSKIAYITAEGGLYIDNVNSLDIEPPLRLIPNILLVDADFRNAHFEDSDLMELVRMSGGIIENAQLY